MQISPTVLTTQCKDSKGDKKLVHGDFISTLLFCQTSKLQAHLMYGTNPSDGGIYIYPLPLLSAWLLGL